MTDKRFIIKNERTVCDGFYGKCFVCSWKSDAEEMCRLLNELYEEREYWKQQAEKRFERIRELEEMIE